MLFNGNVYRCDILNYKDEIINDFNNGFSLENIQDKYNYDYATVKKFLIDCGIDVEGRPNINAIKGLDEDLIVDMYVNGSTYSEILEEVNNTVKCSSSPIIRILKERGVYRGKDKSYKVDPNKNSYIPSKDELYSDYIVDNTPRFDLQVKYNLNEGKLKALIKEYGIKKSSKLRGKNLDSSFKYQSDEDRKKAVEKSKLPENVAKQQNTMVERYGGKTTLESPVLKKRVENTNIERYGHKTAAQNADVARKIGQSGSKNYSENYVETGINYHLENKDIWYNKDKFKDYLIDFYDKNGFKPNYNDLVLFFNTRDRTGTAIRAKIKKWGLEKYFSYTSSAYVDLFLRFLDENNIDYKREYYLKPYYYDFRIGDKLYEINPVSTHNFSVNSVFNRRTYRNKHYHNDKRLVAEKNGFQCIHLFEWDLNNLNKFFPPKTNVIGARECDLKINVNCKDFLNSYHLQGCGRKQNGYGLFINNEMIACMTFSKTIRSNGVVELERYCVHPNFNVKFGAERLFKNFIKNNEVDKIISYCDTTYFKCDVYNKLGFNLIDETNPYYVWVDRNNNHYHRLRFQKSKLKKIFDLNDEMIENLTETQIMEHKGFRKVYCCTNKKYEFKEVK